MPEENDDRIVEGVSRSKGGMHQGMTDVVTLVVGENADRAQADGGGVIDEAFGTHDMADYESLAALGDQGQRRDPPAIGSKRSNEADLDGFGTGRSGPGEGLTMNSVDGLDIVGTLTAYQHHSG